jgi:hypothetical protein
LSFQKKMICFVCHNAKNLTVASICGQDFCANHSNVFAHLERKWYAIQEVYSNWRVYSTFRLSSDMSQGEVDDVIDYIKATCSLL